MNEIKCIEHPTLKVPYEVFNKKYRGAQKVLDIEARQVSNAAGDVEAAVGREAKAGEIGNLLGGMVEKLISMKRKASEAISEELQVAYVCKKRLEHLKDHAQALKEPSSPQVKTELNEWRKTRLDRLLVDYCLRSGYYDTANKLADATSLRELTNVDIYAAAAEVEAELKQRRTARCLLWCADNKSKLRKLNSNLEFKIRIQEFIELVRADKRMEAVKYAKKHFFLLLSSNTDEAQLHEIQQCMGMLAFPKDTEVEPYRALLNEDRWTGLVEQFRSSHGKLLCPTGGATSGALPVLLQLGLHANNTPQCSQSGTKNPSCPSCQPPLNALARILPPAPCTQSRLVCRVSGLPLNEHNQPMVLPNGQVYGEMALKEMMKEHGAIICPKTKEVFCMKRVEKVYIM